MFIPNVEIVISSVYSFGCNVTFTLISIFTLKVMSSDNEQANKIRHITRRTSPIFVSPYPSFSLAYYIICLENFAFDKLYRQFPSFHLCKRKKFYIFSPTKATKSSIGMLTPLFWYTMKVT